MRQHFILVFRLREEKETRGIFARSEPDNALLKMLHQYKTMSHGKMPLKRFPNYDTHIKKN